MIFLVDFTVTRTYSGCIIVSADNRDAARTKVLEMQTSVLVLEADESQDIVTAHPTILES